MTETFDETRIRQVISLAREYGLQGFGGTCGEAAVAINRALFDGRGTLVGAFNEAFLDRDRLLGHVAVKVDDAYWDADGRPKTLDEIEAWGMLDPGDLDHREQAAALGVAWDDDAAESVACVEFDDEEEVLARFGRERLDAFLDAVDRARAAMQEPDAAPGQAL